MYSFKKLLLLLLGEFKSKMILMNIIFNDSLNIRCIGSLVSVYFIDLGVDFYFHYEPPFSPRQCTVHPYKLCNTEF